MPELLLAIYLTLFNLLFKGVCWIALTLFRIIVFIAAWVIRIAIVTIRFLYRQFRKLAAWGWRQGAAYYHTRHPRRMIP